MLQYEYDKIFFSDNYPKLALLSSLLSIRNEHSRACQLTVYLMVNLKYGLENVIILRLN